MFHRAHYFCFAGAVLRVGKQVFRFRVRFALSVPNSGRGGAYPAKKESRRRDSKEKTWEVGASHESSGVWTKKGEDRCYKVKNRNFTRSHQHVLSLAISVSVCCSSELSTDSTDGLGKRIRSKKSFHIQLQALLSCWPSLDIAVPVTDVHPLSLFFRRPIDAGSCQQVHEFLCFVSDVCARPDNAEWTHKAASRSQRPSWFRYSGTCASNITDLSFQ